MTMPAMAPLLSALLPPVLPLGLVPLAPEPASPVVVEPVFVEVAAVAEGVGDGAI